MPKHRWLTRAELEGGYRSLRLPTDQMPDFGCILCGAARSIEDGDALPEEGCIEFAEGCVGPVVDSPSVVP